MFNKIFNEQKKNVLFSEDGGETLKLKEGDKSAEILLNEARATIVASGQSCDVTIAEDFMELQVSRTKTTQKQQ